MKFFLIITIFFLFSKTINLYNIKEVEEKANNGDAESMFDLGNIYYYGMNINITKE
jgi:TPR repeat protein